MKTFLVAVLSIVVVVSFTGCGMFEPTDAWRTVMKSRSSISADDVEGDRYAHELQRQLEAKGIDARVVKFRCGVSLRGGPTFTRTGVIYRNSPTAKIPWWFMESSFASPVWLPNDPVEEQLRFAERVATVEVVTDQERRWEAPLPPKNGRVDLRDLFRARNGSAFDPSSPIDREKMDRLKQAPSR